VSRSQDSLVSDLDAIENNAKCLKNESEHVPQREINNKESEMEIEDYDQVESVNEIEGQIDDDKLSYSIPALPLLLCCPLLKSSFCLLSSSSDESNCPSLILEASI
jgi:hypothetical protein